MVFLGSPQPWRQPILDRDEQAKHIYYPSVPEGELGRQMVSDHVRDMTKQGIVYVADLDGRLLGAIAMHVTQLKEWSFEFGLLNEWFYVLPQFRDSDIAIMLLKAVEEWADADINPWNDKAKPRMPGGSAPGGPESRAFAPMTAVRARATTAPTGMPHAPLMGCSLG